jgi:hypothetical protein
MYPSAGDVELALSLPVNGDGDGGDAAWRVQKAAFGAVLTDMQEILANDAALLEVLLRLRRKVWTRMILASEGVFSFAWHGLLQRA